MSVKAVRNLISAGLAAHIGRPVVKAGQAMPERELPYIYYQFIAPYIHGNEEGELAYSIVPSSESQWEKDFLITRTEHPQATLSFSACAASEDEAIELCENAQSYFLHAGAEALYAQNVAVLEVYDAADRSAWLLDDVFPCWGFDLRIAYKRRDERREVTIEEVNLKRT